MARGILWKLNVGMDLNTVQTTTRNTKTRVMPDVIVLVASMSVKVKLVPFLNVHMIRMQDGFISNSEIYQSQSNKKCNTLKLTYKQAAESVAGIQFRVLKDSLTSRCVLYLHQTSGHVNMTSRYTYTYKSCNR